MPSQDQKLICPLEGIELKSAWCPISTCMFNYNNKCRHAEMSTTPPEEYLEKKGLLDAAKHQAERIKNLIYLDSYIQYVTSKTALNRLTKKDFERLLDEETYYQWPSAVSDKYPVIKQMLVSRSDHLGEKHDN